MMREFIMCWIVSETIKFWDCFEDDNALLFNPFNADHIRSFLENFVHDDFPVSKNGKNNLLSNCHWANVLDMSCFCFQLLWMENEKCVLSVWLQKWSSCSDLYITGSNQWNIRNEFKIYFYGIHLWIFYFLNISFKFQLLH